MGPAIPVKSSAIYEIICRAVRETYTVIKTGKQQFSAGNILTDFYAWTVKKMSVVLNWRSMAT